MNIHLVGGFLGSGKTTAIVNASKQLMEVGQKVGVITNDQGKYLVDTAFMTINDIPAVEVTGGCFCCNYQQLDENIDVLIDKINPDVIFAESVGSCADMVSTVMNPLLTLGKEKLTPGSLSVFADCRLLLRRLKDEPLPFSDDISYIFDQQLEEAGIVVVNKMDLLDPGNLHQLEVLTDKKWPEKRIIFTSAHNNADIQNWLSIISHSDTRYLGNPIDLDYYQYAKGEMKLAWLDQSIIIHSGSTNIRSEIIELINDLIAQIEDAGAIIGHLKFLIEDDNVQAKVSITTQHPADWENQLPTLVKGSCRLLINARVEMTSRELDEIVKKAIQNSELQILVNNNTSFHPAKPNPTYRMNNPNI